MDQHDSITLKQEGSFEIDFPSNAGTGYQWNLNLSPGLKITSVQTRTLNNLPGGNTVQTFTILGTHRGHQSVDAINRRPWEPITGSENMYHLNVNVE